MAKGFWVKVKPQSDFYGTATWKQVSNIWVKTTTTAWQSVSDMWVKVKPASDAYGTATWKALYTAGTAPDTPIQILTSYSSTELLRLQGRNYKWTPAPTTLEYKFVSVDTQDSMISDITDWATTSNPTTSSTLPTASTYVTIANDSPAIYAGTTNRIQFIVKGTTSSGLTFTYKDEFSLVLPKAPTVTATPLSATQVKLNITRDPTDAEGVAKRYIVYLWDGSVYRYAGNTVGITGLGGYNVSETGNEITIGGLSPSVEYSFVVTPITGTAGSTMSNYYGYAGLEGTADSTTISPYTFTFGKVLHVGTNGYIGLDAGATSDSITSTGTGRFVGIFPADLSQLSTTSLWYWSDTSKFIIRWEGTGYNQPSQTRTYQITFYKDQSYATVYMIDVTGGSPGNQAMVKDNTVQTTYPSTPATGSAYNVYFDGTTTPVVFLGASVQSKGTMVQVSGLTSGSLDQGYTSITTSTNQSVTPTLGAFDISSFTKGVVYSSSQGASRSTTLTWDASNNATAYQIQYQGSNDNTNWTTVQAYSSTNNISSTTDTKNWSTSGGNFGYYTFMRANVRSLESTNTATYVYSNNSAYVEAAGTAPGSPTFGTITTANTTASIPFTVGTSGTNYLYSSIQYKFKTSSGTYPTDWSTATITNGEGTISLTGLTQNTDYYIKIRTRNYDELYSPEVESSIFKTTTGGPITSVSYNGAGTITLTANGGGPNWQIYWNTISSQPSGAYYDAVSTTNVITDTLTPSTGSSYWFWVRYSTANLGTSTSSGSAANGTYSNYEGPYIMRHINYNFNGGSDTNYSTFIKDGSDVTLPTPSARTGYTFAGWWDATSGGANLGSSTSIYTVSSTLTAYARWTAETYTISYDANGGTGAPSDQTKTYGIDLTLSSTKPTRTDYGFTGWNTNSSGTGSNYTSGGNYTANAAATLYAKWGSLYTISFNSQSGTSVSDIQQSTVGGSIAKPTDPTRTDYTFGGWATSSTGTTAVTWPRTPTASETLYAIWTAAATAPSAPTSPSMGASSITKSLSTSLTRISNTRKNQYWDGSVKADFTMTWTAGTGATKHEVFYNSTGTAPDASTAADYSDLSTSLSDYFYYDTATTWHYWVRARNDNGVSAWVKIGTKSIPALSVTGYQIRIYRGNGTSYGTAANANAFSDGYYEWTVTSRGDPDNTTSPGEGHYAYIQATLNGGTGLTATSTTE